jgi:predicted nuclease with TOPRIM domain
MKTDARSGNTTLRGRALPKIRPDVNDDLRMAIKRLEKLSIYGTISEELSEIRKSLKELRKTMNLLYHVYQELNANIKQERLKEITSRAVALDHKFSHRKDNGE